MGQIMVGSWKIVFAYLENQSSPFLGAKKIPSRVTCLVEQAEHCNQPVGIIVDRCVATTIARAVPIILINNIKQNIWLW